MTILEFQKKDTTKSFKQELADSGVTVKEAIVMGGTVIIDCDASKKAAVEAYMAANYNKTSEKP
jgi:hypothetical protein